jgi:hypothetical protein
VCTANPYVVPRKKKKKPYVVWCETVRGKKKKVIPEGKKRQHGS